MTLEYPEDLRYLDSHEYVRLDGDIATIGITAFAIEQLGDIVFIEVPGEGEAITKGDPLGNIESVKAVEELYAPISGTVIEQNTAVLEAPEQLGGDPYGEGWLLKVRIDDPEELDDTLSASEYRSQVEGT